MQSGYQGRILIAAKPRYKTIHFRSYFSVQSINTMKWLVILGLGLVSLSLADDQKYTDRYDNMNIDEILANQRLLVPYIKCILGEGRCTPEGKTLKNTIKDAMTTSCEKCTDSQKKGARKVVKHLKEHEQKYWNQMKSKYDPGDKYQESYEAFLARDV